MFKGEGSRTHYLSGFGVLCRGSIGLYNPNDMIALLVVVGDGRASVITLRAVVCHA